MDIIFRSAFIFFTALLFIGCSDSDGQDSDAKHYQQLADSYYAGNTSVADININSAQQFVRYFDHNDLILNPYILFSSFNYPQGGVFRNAVDQWGRTREGNEATTQEPKGKHYEFSCAYSGSFSIEDGIEAFDAGSFNVSFNDCQTQTDTTYNGSAVLKIITNTEDKEEHYLFMEQLTAQSNDITILVSGYTYSASSPREGTEEATYTSTAKSYLTHQYPNKSIKQRFERSSTYSYVLNENSRRGISSSDSSGHTSSTIYDSELGYAEIDTGIAFEVEEHYNSVVNIQRHYRLTGDSAAEFTFPTDDLVRYSEDTNNNGTQDVGFYFFGLSHFKTSPLTDITLVNLSELTQPPAVRKPYISTSPLTVSSIFQASTVYYEDDTLADEVSEYYNWYINGELVTGENSNTLPAFIAVAGDKIQVSIVVTYGTNTIESQRSTVKIVED